MVASGRYHRSVRSVHLARLQDSFRFPFLSRLGDYLTVPPKKNSDPVATLPPSPSLRRRHLAAVAKRAAVLLPHRAAPLRPSLPARSHASTARTSLARARPASLLAVRHQSSPCRRDSPRATVPPVFQGHQVSSCPSPTSYIVGKTKFFNLDLL